MKIANKAGYKLGFTVKKGKVHQEDEMFELNRITGDGSLTGEELVTVIENTK